MDSASNEKLWYNKDEVYCYWVFIWAILSILFPKYYPFYPSYITGIILLVSGFIVAASPIFSDFSKLFIILYHLVVLLGYFIFKRSHNICIDILIFIIYMVFYFIKYKKSPYYMYMRMLNYNKVTDKSLDNNVSPDKINLKQLIAPQNIG
tara:strand:- start:212 stop:661 length:450 start_codon:yes stop_codon:yes gene_type:complete